MKILIAICVLSASMMLCRAACNQHDLEVCALSLVGTTPSNMCSKLSVFKTCAGKAGCSASDPSYQAALKANNIDPAKCSAGTVGVSIAALLTVIMARFL